MRLTQAGSTVARLALVMGLVGPVFVRCSSPTDADPLVRFESCDELQTFLEDRLLQRASAGPLGCAFDEAVGAVEGGDRTFTTTNTQEVDVDEPDFVKNNGDTLFVIRRGFLFILQAWPPESTTILSQTEVRGVPTSMFFDGDERALLFSRAAGTPNQTLLSLYDVSDRSAPRLLRLVTLDAEFVDARRVGDDVVFVTRATVSSPTQLNGAPFHDEANRTALRAAGIGAFLPKLHDFIAGADDSTDVDDDNVDVAAVACDNTYAPRNTNSSTLTLAHRISMSDATAPIVGTGVVANVDSVYASTDNLYLVGADRYDGGPFTPDYVVTRIHKLGNLDEAGRAPYLGGVVFAGAVKDELSLDEARDGTLRVVVTENDDGNNDPRANESALLVFREGGGLTLDEIGRVDDIGHGEVVESVRFFDDRAYVVTFPPLVGTDAFDDAGMPVVPFDDPLYAIDLRDPTAPVVRGELVVDGYSAYLHPYDDDHLLAVGVRTTDDGAFAGLQLSLFDVSDLDAPALVQRYSFGDADSSSEALVERHAFTYFAEQHALAIPYQHTAHDVVDQTALAVFSVDVDAGFGLVGLIDQLPLYLESLSTLRTTEAPCGAVRRSVMMNDPERGAVVYAVSTAGVSVAPLSPDLPVVRSVAFPLNNACDFSGSPL